MYIIQIQKSFPKIFIGCAKHSHLRRRWLRRESERFRPLKNLLRQRPLQETLPALRPMEVDGHRVLERRMLHHEVRRLELRGRVMGDLLPRPGTVCGEVDRRSDNADQNRIPDAVSG